MKRKSVYIFYLFVLLLSIVPAVWLSLVSYDEICRLILSKSGKLYKLQEFQNQFLTPTRFNILRISAFTAPIIFSALIFFAAKNRFIQKKLADFLAGTRYLLGFLKIGVSNIPRIEKALIIAFFSAFSLRTLYTAITSPVTSDEAWTYLIFVSRGLPVSLGLNYSPNNHILYSILANFSFYLPFDSTFNLRLPSIILTIVCCFLFFISVRLLFNTLTAFLTTALLVSLYPFIYYSIQARGYMLVTLLFTICFFALLAIIKTGRREFWVVYSGATILGAYTLPSFVYPFFSLSLFAFIYFLYNRQYQEVKRLIISSAVIGTTVFALYLPVFALSGVSSLVANEYVQPIERLVVLQSLPEYGLSLLWWLFGNLFLGLILIVVAPFVKSSNNKMLANLAIFCLLLVPLICFLHSRLPYVRIWIYLVVAVAAAALPLAKLIDKFRLNIWAVSLICLAILVGGEFNYAKKISADEYETRAAKASRYTQFLTDKNLKNFYVEEDSTSIYVDYFLTTQKRGYKIHYGFSEPLDINQNYDCLILKAVNSISANLEGYNLVYADDVSKIFVKSR